MNSAFYGTSYTQPAALCAAARGVRLSSRRSCVVRAAITLPEEYTKVTVRGGNILVKSAEAEQETKGGVLLPSQAQRKPTSGLCVLCPSCERADNELALMS